MSDLTLEQKRELLNAGRYSLGARRIAYGFRFASEEQQIEYIDKHGEWYDMDTGQPRPTVVAIPSGQHAALVKVGWEPEAAPVNPCAHAAAEMQLVCERCGYREALGARYDAMEKLAEEALKLVRSGYDGEFMGEDVRAIFTAAIAYEKVRGE